MPRQASITYDDVVGYAEAIKAEGGKPTSRTIRDRHGSASYGTVHRLLQQWEQTQARVVAAEFCLPPSVQDAIFEFVQNKLSTGCAELESRLRLAVIGADDLALENECQALLIEEQSNTINALRGEIIAQDGRLSEIQISLATLREELVRERQSVEIARIEVAKLMLRLERLPSLEAELTEARNENWLIDRSLQEVEKELAVSKSVNLTLEKSKNTLLENAQARLIDTQNELRIVVEKFQEAQSERFKTAVELAAVHATRGDEGSRVAERIGALEGSLASLQQATPASVLHNSV